MCVFYICYISGNKKQLHFDRVLLHRCMWRLYQECPMISSYICFIYIYIYIYVCVFYICYISGNKKQLHFDRVLLHRWVLVIVSGMYYD